MDICSQHGLSNCKSYYAIRWLQAMGNNFIMGVPGQSGLTLVTPGLVFESGSWVRAFAANSGSIFLTGYVDRIT